MIHLFEAAGPNVFAKLLLPVGGDVAVTGAGELNLRLCDRQYDSALWYTTINLVARDDAIRCC